MLLLADVAAFDLFGFSLHACPLRSVAAELKEKLLLRVWVKWGVA